MKARRKPTSVILNERNRLASELYRACAEGHMKDIRKLKPKFNQACESYEKRLIEDEKIQQEKEAKKLAKRNKIIRS